MSTAITLVDPILQMAGVDRPQEVLNEIMYLKGDIMVRVLRLGRLLREAQENAYYLGWGFGSLPAWIEHSSGLDLSERDAYYAIRVVKRSEELGIPDEELLKVKYSKLKAILSLKDEQASPDQVRAMVKGAETRSLKLVKEDVNKAKKMDFVYRTLKNERETDESVIQPAFERMRREYGDTISEDGNPADITDSKIVELLCAEYLASPEEEDYDIVDAEYADSYVEAGEAA